MSYGESTQSGISRWAILATAVVVLTFTFNGALQPTPSPALVVCLVATALLAGAGGSRSDHERSPLGLSPDRPRILLLTGGIVAGCALYFVRTVAAVGLTGGTIGPGSLREFSAVMAIVVVLSASVAAQEVLFRGYPFLALAERIGPRAATIALGVLYGIYHLAEVRLWTRPLAMLAIVISTGLIHVLFAVAFVRSRSLYLPIGLHFGWNVAARVLLARSESLLIVVIPDTRAAAMIGHLCSVAVVVVAIAIIGRRAAR